MDCLTSLLQFLIPKFAFYLDMKMKKSAFLFLFVLVMASCSKKVEKADFGQMNGYWEIEKVIMPDGSEKDYTVNQTIDFFEINDTVGFRKKVMPQFDGTYRTNDMSEKLTIGQKDGKTIISYTTEYAKWQEELITVDDDELVVKNQHNIEYHYKKPEPFTIK